MSSVFNICGGADNSFTPAPKKIIPQGTLEITENGEYNVSEFANANVNVSSGGGDDSFQKLIDRSIVIANIPEGTSEIGSGVFQNCTNLEQVFIPSGLRKVNMNAFRTCTKLKSVIMADSGVTYIDNYAFYGCSALESIILPDSLQTIRESSFNSCSSLRSITCRATTPPTIMSNSFNSVPSNANIFVPAASVEAYKSANYWSSRAAYIQAIAE